jgi:hypothetical protein
VNSTLQDVLGADDDPAMKVGPSPRKIGMPENSKSQSMPRTELQPGPMRHESLTLRQQELARHTYESCGHFYYSSFEHWEREFLCDVDPNQELLFWYAIAQSFEQLRSRYPDKEHRRLLGQVVRCATGSTPTKYPEIADIHASVCGKIAGKTGIEWTMVLPSFQS